MKHPDLSAEPYAIAEQVSPLVRRVLAYNPSPFSYTGTQTYIVGTGEGLMGGLGTGGDFMDIPDIGEITLFGGGQSVGNDMRVSYYNLNLLRSGKSGAMTPGAYDDVIRNYLQYSGAHASKYSKSLMFDLILSYIFFCSFLSSNSFVISLNFSSIYASSYLNI